MTDITDQDRRAARRFARAVARPVRGVPRTEDMEAAARVILASVDDPASTLVGELRGWEKIFRDEGRHVDATSMRDLATRAEQMETEWEEELDQISADCDHWCAENARLIDKLERVRHAARDLMHEGKTAAEWMQAYEEAAQDLSEARAEVERLTAERDEITADRDRLAASNYILGAKAGAATVAREENVTPDQQGDPLPDPADVPEGQAWAVSIDDMEETAGFKASGFGWICYRELGGTTKAIPSDRITLVSRLVPAPRQITTRGELNALPEGTVVRAKGELACERYRHRSKGLVWISTGVDEDFPVDRPVLPATVLWTPEVPA